jgi:hypothetical protein
VALPGAQLARFGRDGDQGVLGAGDPAGDQVAGCFERGDGGFVGAQKRQVLRS